MSAGRFASRNVPAAPACTGGCAVPWGDGRSCAELSLLSSHLLPAVRSNEQQLHTGIWKSEQIFGQVLDSDYHCFHIKSVCLIFQTGNNLLERQFFHEYVKFTDPWGMSYIIISKRTQIKV